MGRVSQEERRRQVLEQKRHARARKEEHRVAPQDRPGIAADCFALGQAYGVGVGLYFKTLGWLRLLFLWLALGAAPFLVLISSAKFTSPALAAPPAGSGAAAGGPALGGEAQEWDSPYMGARVYPRVSLFTFTFAAILDSRLDGGMLSWMNVRLPGAEAIRGLRKSDFLMWISITDAATMAVFIVITTLMRAWSRRFAKEIDAHTVEVADYTVVVKGLPEVEPTEVGAYFSRFGRVMDVVLVKDFGVLLRLSAQATALEQQRAAAGEMLGRHFARAYQRRVDKTERKLKAFMEQADDIIDRAGCPTKAIFVTFGTQEERAGCEAACPKSWLASFLQPRGGRFPGRAPGSHAFWVEQAQPPEDYIYENLSYGRAARWARLAVSRAVVVAVLLLTAVGVTKLMKMSRDSAATVTWRHPLIAGQVAEVMRSRNATSEAWAGASSTLDSVEGAAAFCAAELAGTCSTKLSLAVESPVTFKLGGLVKWGLTAARFLKRDQLFKDMLACMEHGSACPLFACYPCYCGGLATAGAAGADDGDWLAAAKEECGPYIDSLDWRSLGIRRGRGAPNLVPLAANLRSSACVWEKELMLPAGISVFVVVINLLLKALLQVLVAFERHWTKSDKERAYAVAAFVSQLLNSVLVLLAVNAKMETVSAAINSGLTRSSAQGRWFQNLVLAGSYRDFSPGWYENVGVSILIVAVLNVVLPPAFAFSFWALRKLRQRCLTRCVAAASQQAFDGAWMGDEFLLDYRVCDQMLNLWLLLMFGSGMPLLYAIGVAWLIVIEVVDRHALARLCRRPVRYGPRLPYLLLDVLPWAAASHCAFGLWMHTYHAAKSGDLSALGVGSASSNTLIASVANSGVWARITQVNGLPLLCLLLVHVIFFFIVSGVLYGVVGRALEALCGCKIAACCGGGGPQALHPIPFDEALAGGGAKKLCGTPTYRMPRHPMYRDTFSNPMYKPIWFKAFGLSCYTRLVSRRQGGFVVTSEPVLAHHTEDLEEAIAQMSPELQAAARKLAEGGDEGSITSKARAPPLPRMHAQGWPGWCLHEGPAG
ncbi:MAG: hypothetical protein J3K34DRAFT_477538 [Monoraphidium minutum]|nr:MAG: hypothetical protein J3K34DRAFT_477538 [Monoraphidium minutum]